MGKVLSNSIAITDDRVQKGLQTNRSVRNSPPKTQHFYIITRQCIFVLHFHFTCVDVHNVHQINADSAAPHDERFTIANCTPEVTVVVTHIVAPHLEGCTEKGLLSLAAGNINDVVMADLLRLHSHHVTTVISCAGSCPSMPQLCGAKIHAARHQPTLVSGTFASIVRAKTSVEH